MTDYNHALIIRGESVGRCFRVVNIRKGFIDCAYDYENGDHSMMTFRKEDVSLLSLHDRYFYGRNIGK